MVWLMVTMMPLRIKALTTSAPRTAMRAARSWTVIISGTTTSRTVGSLGRCRLLAALAVTLPLERGERAGPLELLGLLVGGEDQPLVVAPGVALGATQRAAPIALATLAALLVVVAGLDRLARRGLGRPLALLGRPCLETGDVHRAEPCRISRRRARRRCGLLAPLLVGQQRGSLLLGLEASLLLGVRARLLLGLALARRLLLGLAPRRLLGGPPGVLVGPGARFLLDLLRFGRAPAAVNASRPRSASAASSAPGRRPDCRPASGAAARRNAASAPAPPVPSAASRPPVPQPSPAVRRVHGGA